MPALLLEVIRQLTVRQRVGLQTQIRTGLIQGYRVKGRQHAQIRQNRSVVFPVTVAVRRDVHDHIDVENRLSGSNRRGILRHFATEDFGYAVESRIDRIEGAGADTPAAALAEALVDDGFARIIGNRIGAAFLRAFAAAAAEVRIDHGFSLIMLLHFSGPAAAAHAQVLDGAAETGELVALEMAEDNNDIRIVQRPADIGFPAEFAIRHRDRDIVRSLQAVRNDVMTSGRHIVEAVDIRIQQMIHRVFPGTGIERVTVREEGLSAVFLDQVGNGFYIIGPQVREIPELAEMQLDGHKLPFKVDFVHSGQFAKVLEFYALAYIQPRTEISKIHFCLFHFLFLRILIVFLCAAVL